MLRIIRLELSEEDPVPINKDSSVNRIDSNSEVSETKSRVKTDKSKNMILAFLAKSKLFTEPSSKANFHTFEIKLVFTNLRQAFIKISILYHFDSEYLICIKTNLSSYTISRVLSHLTLDNSDQ